MSDIIEIKDFHLKGLDFYARFSERQLQHYYEPDKRGLFIAESPKTVDRALQAGYEPVSILVERKDIAGEAAGTIAECEARCPGIPVYTADFDTLTRLLHFQMLRGMFCLMRRKTLPDPAGIIKGASRIAILEKVMNPTNVGAIFRSAAALGMDAVLLTPGCSDPLYRRSIRVSMGTVFQVPWTYAEWPQKGFSVLRREGFQTAALALREQSLPLGDPRISAAEKLAVILGTEGEGLADETIDACDYIVRIPMAHGVDSLNVAAASAVTFWELRKRGSSGQPAEPA